MPGNESQNLFRELQGKQIFFFSLFIYFPGGSDNKESACKAGDLASIPGLGRSPLSTLGFLPEESRRQRNLLGYSPWGHKELGTAEQVTLALTLSFLG